MEKFLQFFLLFLGFILEFFFKISIIDFLIMKIYNFIIRSIFWVFRKSMPLALYLYFYRCDIAGYIIKFVT